MLGHLNPPSPLTREQIEAADRAWQLVSVDRAEIERRYPAVFRGGDGDAEQAPEGHHTTREQRADLWECAEAMVWREELRRRWPVLQRE